MFSFFSSLCFFSNSSFTSISCIPKKRAISLTVILLLVAKLVLWLKSHIFSYNGFTAIIFATPGAREILTGFAFVARVGSFAFFLAFWAAGVFLRMKPFKLSPCFFQWLLLQNFHQFPAAFQSLQAQDCAPLG